MVDEWVKELASTDLHDRLIEEVGPASWDHYLERAEWESRIREIASQLLQHESNFDQELTWLNSDKARSSVEFGIQLGRLDESLKFLDRIVTVCCANRNANLTRGYFAGVSESARTRLPSDAAEVVRRKLNESLDEIWKEDPVLGFNVMMASGDFVQSFARAIAGVPEKKIPARLLRTLLHGTGRDTLRPGKHGWLRKLCSMLLGRVKRMPRTLESSSSSSS